MQIVQKDISENLHIRDVGALCGEIGREDSDAPPQGALVTRGPQIKVATVLFIFQINQKVFEKMPLLQPLKVFSTTFFCFLNSFDVRSAPPLCILDKCF